MRTPSTGVVTWMVCDRAEDRLLGGFEEGEGGWRRSAADENRTLGSSEMESGMESILLGERGCDEGDLGRYTVGLVAGDAKEGKPAMTASATPPGVDRRGIPGRAFMPLAPAEKQRIDINPFPRSLDIQGLSEKYPVSLFFDNVKRRRLGTGGS